MKKKTNFDGKVRSNSTITANKAKHVEAEKKLNSHITFYIKLIID